MKHPILRLGQTAVRVASIELPAGSSPRSSTARTRRALACWRDNAFHHGPRSGPWEAGPGRVISCCQLAPKSYSSRTTPLFCPECVAEPDRVLVFGLVERVNGSLEYFWPTVKAGVQVVDFPTEQHLDCRVQLGEADGGRHEHPPPKRRRADGAVNRRAPGRLQSADPAVGAFHGMVVRALLGDGPAGLTPERPLAPQQVIIGGEQRAGDVSEHEYLAKTGLRGHGVDDLERVLDGLRGPVHIDLDVLEPTACYPEPGGVQPQRLIDLISQVDDIIGAAITEHAPPSPRRRRRRDPSAGRHAGALKGQPARPRP